MHIREESKNLKHRLRVQKTMLFTGDKKRQILKSTYRLKKNPKSKLAKI